MKRWLIRLLLAVLLVLPLSGIALYFALDAWLESAGGQQALEQSLSRQTGLEVVLGEGFSVDLYPSLGAGGSQLRMDSAQGTVLQAESYHLAVALKPLLDGVIQVESVRLDGGLLQLDKLPAAASDSAAPAPSIQWPRVQLLAIDDLQVEAGPQSWRVDFLQISDFAAGKPSTIELNVAGWGTVTGLFTVAADATQFSTRFNWKLQNWQAELDLTAQFPHGMFSTEQVSLDLARLQLTLDGQIIHGRACGWWAERPAVSAQLTADALDLDQLLANMPTVLTETFTQAADGKPAIPAELPLDLHLTLAANRFVSADVVALNARLEVGEAMACKPLQRP